MIIWEMWSRNQIQTEKLFEGFLAATAPLASLALACQPVLWRELQVQSMRPNHNFEPKNCFACWHWARRATRVPSRRTAWLGLFKSEACPDSCNINGRRGTPDVDLAPGLPSEKGSLPSAAGCLPSATEAALDSWSSAEP